MHLEKPKITISDSINVGLAAFTENISTRSGIVSKFESKLSDKFGGNCFCTNSGTSALHLALLACGVGPGDEVVVPALTFRATVNAVIMTGATPVIVDVRPDTWNMVDDTPYAKVSIGVDLYGVPCLPRLPIGTKFIVDAAHSLGIKLNGQRRGLDYSCTSFNRNKMFTGGCGGAVFGINLSGIKRLGECGRGGFGYNYRMTGLSAALCLSQFKRFDKMLKWQRKLRDLYLSELTSFFYPTSIRFQDYTAITDPSWWYTAVLFSDHDTMMRVAGVIQSECGEYRRIFQPLNTIADYPDADCPVAEDIYDRGLCLPRSPLNSWRDVKRLCKKIRVVL